MRGNRSELAPGRKSPRCHVNTPLDVVKIANNAKDTWDVSTLKNKLAVLTGKVEPVAIN